MASPPVDHRRATAERNAAAILDATERLLAGGQPLNMRALAAEAGVSRPTLYAHVKSIEAAVEAVVSRAVRDSRAAIDAAEPQSGPADGALRRVAAASWGRLAHFDALARGAMEHLSAAAMHRAHAPLVEPLRDLVRRGQADGAFRTDLPEAWLVDSYFALVHGADDHARRHRVKRDRALELLTTTLRDLFRAR
jgi:TetR/AcrR family transcriptional repressor of mexCD-oprJ operon